MNPLDDWDDFGRYWVEFTLSIHTIEKANTDLGHDCTELEIWYKRELDLFWMMTAALDSEVKLTWPGKALFCSDQGRTMQIASRCKKISEAAADDLLNGMLRTLPEFTGRFGQYTITPDQLKQCSAIAYRELVDSLEIIG